MSPRRPPPTAGSDLLEEARAMMARATARRERSAGVSGHVTSLATRPPHPRPTRRPRSSSSPPPEQPLKRHQASSPTTRCFDLEHDPVDAPPGECSEEDPWGFGCEVVSRFPALGRRSFFCIQWHQATALHYDLRLQCAYALDARASGIVDVLERPTHPGTLSFAIPLGCWDTRRGEMRLAVETNIHSIAYTVFEGPQSDPSGRWTRDVGGMPRATLLWEIGSYTIARPAEPEGRHDSSAGEEDESDDGVDRRAAIADPHDEERLLLAGMQRGKFTVTLHGHRKLHSLTLHFRRTAIRTDSRGRAKVEWSVMRARGEQLVTGPEDRNWHRSILTGRTLREVGDGPPAETPCA